MYKKVDWEKIKAEYITTDISLRDLADKYNVSSQAMAIRLTTLYFNQPSDSSTQVNLNY